VRYTWVFKRNLPQNIPRKVNFYFIFIFVYYYFLNKKTNQKKERKKKEEKVWGARSHLMDHLGVAHSAGLGVDRASHPYLAKGLTRPPPIRPAWGFGQWGGQTIPR
jgi:hypothetical protein